MSIFKMQKQVIEPLPMDVNDPLVEDIYASYPFRLEAFGLKSIIRTVVWTVLQMKDRGFLK